MKISRFCSSILVVLAICAVVRSAAGQGITTGAISGIVTNGSSHPMSDVQVEVTNRQTGTRTGARTNEKGLYFVQGLEVGGPYSVSIRRIGYAPQTKDGYMVALSQNVRVDFQLSEQAVHLAGVSTIASAENAVMSSSHTGLTSTITDSALARMPTLNRNFTDFLRLSPLFTTKGPGNSAGGANNRFNAIQVDGSIATDLFGLGSTGQPGGQANAKQAPLGAIKEYQILLSPYDVRQGDFTGALVNAVTKSGTNEWHGEAVGNYRNQYLEENVPYIRNAPFTQDQYGLSVGGPIVKDRVHLFVSAENQNESTPANGPYFGQPASVTANKLVNSDSLSRFINILQNTYGYGNVGGAQQVTNKNPLSNAFARLDVADLPFNSRAVIRYNYAAGNIDVFSRSNTAWELSNNGYNFSDATNNGTVQVFTNFANGNSNEFQFGATYIADLRVVPIWAPYVTVKNVPLQGGGTTSLVAGTDNSSQGNQLQQHIWELSDNFSIPWGDHVFTIGTKDDFYAVRNLFSQNSLGNYTFGSIDSLAAGLPERVQVGKRFPDNTPDGAARFQAQTLGFYAGDQWQVRSNVNVTLGLRVDVPSFLTNPGTNDSIVKYLAINTANMPKNQAEWSPRIGFNWDVTGKQTDQLRGGTGIFMGLPAYVWMSDAYGNSGVNGYASFTCSSPATAPKFPGATGAVPQNCANGTAATPVTVNTVNPDLKFPSVWRSSLGYDKRLPWGVIGTLEGQYSSYIQQFYYQNIGLQDNPIGTDRNGRSLYGDIVNGSVRPAYKTGVNDVINLTNETSNKDYSYSVTAQLQKRFSDRFEGSLAYTHSRSYDQYDLTSSVAYSNWQFGRDYAGSQNAQTLAPSKWDIPDRIVATGTYTFPTKTDLTFIFTGESGAPYTFVYFGDMNGDGSANNDPIYVPKDAHTASEIMFAPNGGTTVQQQQDALNNLISSMPCLNFQRGQIMARNSCRFPWTQELDLSLRQSLPTLRLQNITVEWDVFNFLNLLNKNWGWQNFAANTNDPSLLSLFSFANGTSLRNGAQGVFKYNTTFTVANTQNVYSAYRMQMLVKYSF